MDDLSGPIHDYHGMKYCTREAINDSKYCRYTVTFVLNIWLFPLSLHSQPCQIHLTESSCVPLQTKLILYSISPTLSFILLNLIFILKLLTYINFR